MWIKQFSWYDMQGQLLLEDEALEEALSQKKAYKPHATQGKSLGWISPLGEGQPLAVDVGGYLWLSARLDQRLLPANVVNNLLKEKLAELEAQQGYPVGAKQRRVQRDELILELLPKAFIQSKNIQVVVDKKHRVLIIDQTSSTIKDAVVDLLRQSVGSLALTHHIDQKSAIAQALKKWVVRAPEGVEVEPEYTLIHPNNIHAKARIVGLDEAMVMAPLESGMTVSQLVASSQQIRFQINDQLDVSRIKYLNVEEAEKDEDPARQALAEFALSVPYLTQLIQDFKEWFPITERVEEEDVVE